MPLIKRYPNRKLYNTEAKQYITLDGIADLIRQGETVQVIDHASGEDLTALTLSQIIFEQEKKRGGFLPESVLTGLIQAGGDTLNSLRRTLATPLNMLHHIEEEIDRRIQTLISSGDLSEEDGLRLRSKLIPGKGSHPAFDRLTKEHITRVLAAHGVPSKEDLAQLNQQLEVLAAKLDDLALDKEAS